MAARSIELTLLAEQFAVCRLAAGAPVPDWALRGSFFSVTRTTDELSVVCPVGHVPPGIPSTSGWRALKFHGPFDFNETGILSSVLKPLEHSVGIFAISTFDTDYLLMREADLAPAIQLLREAGHRVHA